MIITVHSTTVINKVVSNVWSEFVKKAQNTATSNSYSPPRGQRSNQKTAPISTKVTTKHV